MTEKELAICRTLGAAWVSRDSEDDADVRLWNARPEKKRFVYDGEETFVYYFPSAERQHCVAVIGAAYFPSIEPGECVQVARDTNVLTEKPLSDWTVGEIMNYCEHADACCDGCVLRRVNGECIFDAEAPICWKVDNSTQPRVEGVSPDTPITTNAQGGKQSDTPYAFHMLPTGAVFAAAQVAAYGAAKYGETFENRNYTKIPAVEHINHCIQHLYAYLAGDTQDDHLAHAIVRAMFAYETAEREND